MTKWPRLVAYVKELDELSGTLDLGERMLGEHELQHHHRGLHLDHLAARREQEPEGVLVEAAEGLRLRPAALAPLCDALRSFLERGSAA